jgi:hypothetical protein
MENPFAPYPTSNTPWLILFLAQIRGHETPPMYVCMNTAFNPTEYQRSTFDVSVTGYKVAKMMTE